MWHWRLGEMILKNSAFLTEINYSLKYTQKENSYFKSEKYFTILLFLLYFFGEQKRLQSVFSCIFHIRLKMLYNYLDLVMFCHIFYLHNMALKSGVRSLAYNMWQGSFNIIYIVVSLLLSTFSAVWPFVFIKWT